ncbi:secreted protein [methanotrophic bacterial endosymbiont of Bathymodiolus sp.]|nr:secreted protein [methanotrophic bacterial endosymbiont of Bathymodiolus sp.]
MIVKLLVLAFVLTHQFASADELLRVDIDKEITNKNYTIHDANRSASEKRAARTLKRKFNSLTTTKVLTETLYNQLDSIRYAAQLVEENTRPSFLGKSSITHDVARLAQVLWLDLLRVAESRRTIDRANESKKITPAEEKIRAKGYLDWATKYKGNAYDLWEYYRWTPVNERYLPKAKTTLDNAVKLVSDATDMYNESSKFVELLIEDNVIRELDKQKSAANDYVQSVIDAHNIFNERNATVEELLSDPWVIDQSTFNYRLPCTIEETTAVAIVIHGENRKDFLEPDSDGMLVYPYDVSAVFSDMLNLCVALTVPKSGRGAFVTRSGDVTEYREWWMVEDTEARTEEVESNAVIDLIDLAFEVIHKPIYLVYGNDSGYLASKVTKKLKELGKINIIYGVITVDSKAGEFKGHKLDGTTWVGSGIIIDKLKDMIKQ